LVYTVQKKSLKVNFLFCLFCTWADKRSVILKMIIFWEVLFFVIREPHGTYLS